MFKCKYCGKEFEKKQQLAGHIIWCKENPNKTGKSNFSNIHRKTDIIQDNLFCKYCGKQCKNKNSLVQHEIRCKENPNKIDFSNSSNNIIKYNLSVTNNECEATNQFIKARRLGLEIPKVSNETKEKLANVWKGKKHTEETKEKQRNGFFKYKETLLNTKIVANYNKNSISFIDNLNEKMNWNLQHAENGGEVKICGYFVDGYDKELNIVFEYDEPRHYKDVFNNVLCEKDIKRQNNIYNKINCKFYRYNERLDLFYEVNFD